MKLRDKIMNLPASPSKEFMLLSSVDTKTGYNAGHFDARHAAAELAILEDALMDEATAMLKEALQPLELYNAYGWSDRKEVRARMKAIIAKLENKS